MQEAEPGVSQALDTPLAAGELGISGGMVSPTDANIARIKRLGGGPGMSAPLARAALRGLGNAAASGVLARSTGGVIARSALSDELRDIRMTGGVDAMIARLRTVNVSDPDVEAMIAADLTGDDLWLAQNLVQYGPEASWPIHLRVEKEMKHFPDSGGKGAAFNLLRAGAQPGNADLTASIARLFPAGTEDSILANLLQRYGDEAGWPAPVNEYQCPFDFAPQSSPGERILYNGNYLMVPAAISHYHELVATGTNGSFDAVGGPAQKVFRTGSAANRIDTGNFSFFIPAAFAGSATASVKIELKIRSTGAVVNTQTWNFTPRSTPPTEVRQIGPAGETAIGSAYTYQVGPALPTGQIPFYEHQTVLEEFAARTSNLEVADMDPAWLTAQGVTDKAGIDAKLFGGGSNNGTFTIDNLDQYGDQHGGGQSELDAAAAHLKAPKEIWVDLPQTYTAGPGNVLGHFTIRRIRHAAGGYGLMKWKT